MIIDRYETEETTDEDIYESDGVTIRDGCGLRVLVMDGRNSTPIGTIPIRATPIRVKGAHTKMTDAIDPRDQAFAELQLRDQAAWKPQNVTPKVIPTGYVESARRAEPKPFDWRAAPALRTGDPVKVKAPPANAIQARDAAFAELQARDGEAWKHATPLRAA